MKYICIEDLITFINFINSDDDAVLWKNGINPVCLEDLVNDGISQKKVRTLQLEDPANSLSSTPDYLEERVKKLEEAVWPKNIDHGSYRDSVAPAVKKIAFESRGEAEQVLKRMRKQLEKDKILTVAEYYLLAGEPRYISYPSYKYGWTKLNTVSIYSYCDYRGKGERIYGLRLPEPMPIENY